MSQTRSRPQDPKVDLEAVHERLTAAITSLANAEDWQRMLRLAAALPSYSAHNVLLIGSQRPDATAVAGFHTWKQLGRAVRKGERGIAILAPVVRRSPRTAQAQETRAAETEHVAHEEQPAASTVRKVTGFRVVHVFDISQTTGPDLPELPQPLLLDGQAPNGLLDGLTQHVHDEGYLLIRHDFDIPHPGQGSPNGVTDFFARTVIVRPDLSGAQTAKTLTHELGHVLLHAPSQRPADLTRPQAEVEAESVAYIVAAAHGLDTSGYSIPYVTGWSGGKLELLARTAERVISTSHQILRRTPRHPPLASEAPARAVTRDAAQPVGRAVDGPRHRSPAATLPTVRELP
jgi:hypothetical protein